MSDNETTWKATAIRYWDKATGICLHVELGHSTGKWTWHVTQSYAVYALEEARQSYATMEEAQAAALHWFQGRASYDER